jgi:hypothetical protein
MKNLHPFNQLSIVPTERIGGTLLRRSSSVPFQDFLRGVWGDFFARKEAAHG